MYYPGGQVPLAMPTAGGYLGMPTSAGPAYSINVVMPGSPYAATATALSPSAATPVGAVPMAPITQVTTATPMLGRTTVLAPATTTTLVTTGVSPTAPHLGVAVPTSPPHALVSAGAPVPVAIPMAAAVSSSPLGVDPKRRFQMIEAIRVAEASKDSAAINKDEFVVNWPKPQWSFFDTAAADWKDFPESVSTSIESARTMGVPTCTVPYRDTWCTLSIAQMLMQHPEGLVAVRRNLANESQLNTVVWSTFNANGQYFDDYPEMVSWLLEQKFQSGRDFIDLILLNGASMTIIFSVQLQIDEQRQYRSIARRPMRAVWERFIPQSGWIPLPAESSKGLEYAHSHGYARMQVITDSGEIQVDLARMRYALSQGQWFPIRRKLVDRNEGTQYTLNIPSPASVDEQARRLAQKRAFAAEFGESLDSIYAAKQLRARKAMVSATSSSSPPLATAASAGGGAAAATTASAFSANGPAPATTGTGSPSPIINPDDGLLNRSFPSEATAGGVIGGSGGAGNLTETSSIAQDGDELTFVFHNPGFAEEMTSSTSTESTGRRSGGVCARGSPAVAGAELSKELSGTGGRHSVGNRGVRSRGQVFTVDNLKDTDSMNDGFFPVPYSVSSAGARNWDYVAPRVDCDNTKHVPGGGKVVIINEQLKWNVSARVDHLNVKHKPGGGNVKIHNEKVKWSAKPKVDHNNLSHKPGGGRVEIKNEKLSFSHVSSKVDDNNLTHKPGGGNVEILNEKIDFSHVSARVDDDNLSHKPGGGNLAIFDEKVDFKKVAPKIDAGKGGKR